MKVSSCLLAFALSLLVGTDARRVKRDAWRTWEGLEVNCDSSPKDNPCVKCSCTTIGKYGDKDYNSCREDTKHCYDHIPCADSIVKPGECCSTCPNGENCSIFGSIVKPGDTKIYEEGSDSKYKVCGAGGVVKSCTIETTILGSSSFSRHTCMTPYGR